MHDFIQHLSFNGQTPFPPARLANKPLRCVVLSFNEAPAPSFRPGPGRRASTRRRTGSKSLNSQLSALN